jgi:DNA polymerase III alpha subunit
VSAERPGRGRTFGAARHVAVVARERAAVPALAHPGAIPPHAQARTTLLIEDVGVASRVGALASGDGPVLAAQWDKADLECLGLIRLEISASASLGSAAIVAAHGGLDLETAAAAWRLLEAGDTLCIGQVESVGIRQLLRRARGSRDEHASEMAVLKDIEDLAQLLALWRPGAWGKQREQAYLEMRFGGARTAYIHPSTARVLGSTAGQLLYVDQLIDLITGLGFEHGWAERFRRSLTGGRHVERRNQMEQELRAAASKRGWTADPDDKPARVAVRARWLPVQPRSRAAARSARV